MTVTTTYTNNLTVPQLEALAAESTAQLVTHRGSSRVAGGQTTRFVRSCLGRNSVQRSACKQRGFAPIASPKPGSGRSLNAVIQSIC